MGNPASKFCVSAGIMLTGAALAAPTGGTSLAITVPILATRDIGTIVMDNCAKNTEFIQRINNSSLFDKKVKILEIRWCQVKGEVVDFLGTLVGRGLLLTEKALHHHFVILTLECNTLIYLHFNSKHRLIQIRSNKDGYADEEWKSSYFLKNCSPQRNGGQVYLKDVISKVKEMDPIYHLTDNNCQHFAEILYKWI